MNGDSLLIDTNIIIYLLNGDEDIKSYLQGNEIYISFVSEMELLSYPEINEDDINEIHQLFKQLKIIDINNSIKEKAITLRRKYKIKLPDSIVLATAQYLGITILTADKQMSRIKEEINLVIYKP